MTVKIEVEGCDTISRLFWHQVKARNTQTAFREKKLGIWRSTSWQGSIRGSPPSPIPTRPRSVSIITTFVD